MPYADACVVVGDEMVYAAYDTIVSMNQQPGGKRVLKTMEEGIGAYGMVENGGLITNGINYFDLGVLTGKQAAEVCPH